MNFDSREGVFSLPGHELSRLGRMLLSCSSDIASPIILSMCLEMFSEIAQSMRTGSAAAAALSAHKQQLRAEDVAAVKTAVAQSFNRYQILLLLCVAV